MEKNNLNTQFNSDYWTNKLSDITNKVTFNYDFDTKLEAQEYRCFTLDLHETLSLKLREFSGNSSVKMHIVFVTAINILLYKYTEAQDITVGSPIYKQKSDGNYINTVLPFRNSISGDLTFKELLLQVKDVMAEAIKRQNYPLKKIINNLEADSSCVGFPIFDVMISVSDIHDKSYVKNIKTNFNFDILNNDGLLKIKIEYNDKLYKQSTVELIVDSFEKLLSEILNDQKIKIRDINILTENQMKKVLYKFNDAKKNYNEDKLLHQLFEEQVERTPNACVLIDGERRITYNELNIKANKIANFLKDNGVTANDRIGIMMDTSIELIAGLLGILKASGTYLPLDPTYPRERVKFMIEDSNIKCVLAQECYYDMFENSIKVFDITKDYIYEASDKCIGANLDPKNLAYIIYTSGTTGKPKGVMIEHRTICRSLMWRRDEYSLNESDTTIQLFSYSFDGFVTSFFTPIISAAKVVLLKKDEIKNPKIIKKYIKEEKVTHFISVPVLYKAILDEVDVREDIMSLKIVTLAGDVVTKDIIKKSKEINAKLELVNEYGPTENSVVTTICRNMDINRDISIGKPVANTKIYILDDNNKLCPIGVPGELCISGERLARGYINREELNLEKFMDNPFEKGQRIYKTGDIAKWCKNGNINLIGRKDDQIKLRGFRIELGEIENKLLELSKIKEAIVVATEDVNNNKCICAYYVSNEFVTFEEMRNHLSERLPDYMVPAYMVELDEIPLTLNGKVDRRNLPKPELNLNSGVDYVEPSNEIEKKIAKQWEKVLNVKPIGVYNNFFASGGDSLKAIQIASKLSEEFEIEINDIYKYQTIKELSKKIKYAKFDINQKLENAKNSILEMKNSKEEIDNKINYNEDIVEASKIYYKNIQKHENISLSDKIYKNILVAGSTGYVGSYLLKDVLQTLEANVYLLVRGKDILDSQTRLIDRLNFYFGEDFYIQYKERIHILNGDMCKSNLGLKKNIYNELSVTIDCIINSAANVKHFGNYSDFYNMNVLGTKELLKFAVAGDKKDYNHMSTISIASGNIEGVNRALFTEFDMDLNQEADNYYAQTKLLAEKLIVQTAREKEINIKIFRLGNVVFNNENGKFQYNISENAFYKFMKSLISIKCFPNIKEKTLDFAFINQVTNAIINTFNKMGFENNIFHISNVNKVSISELGRLIQKTYEGIKIMEPEEFIDFMKKNIENEDLYPFISNILIYLGISNDKEFTQFIVRSDYSNHILNKSGFEWEKLDYKTINNMIKYCEETEYFKFKYN